MPKVKLTTGQIRQMRKLHEEGLSAAEIAEIMGVSKSLVYVRLKDETPAVPVRELDKTSLMTSNEMMARMQQRAEAKARETQPPEPPKAESVPEPVPEPPKAEPAPEEPKPEVQVPEPEPKPRPAMLISSVSYSGNFAMYEVDGEQLVIRAGQDAALKLLKRDLPDLIRELEELRKALASISPLMEEDGQ